MSMNGAKTDVKASLTQTSMGRAPPRRGRPPVRAPRGRTSTLIASAGPPGRAPPARRPRGRPCPAPAARRGRRGRRTAGAGASDASGGARAVMTTTRGREGALTAPRSAPAGQRLHPRVQPGQLPRGLRSPVATASSSSSRSPCAPCAMTVQVVCTRSRGRAGPASRAAARPGRCAPRPARRRAAARAPRRLASPARRSARRRARAARGGGRSSAASVWQVWKTSALLRVALGDGAQRLGQGLLAAVGERDVGRQVRHQDLPPGCWTAPAVGAERRVVGVGRGRQHLGVVGGPPRVGGTRCAPARAPTPRWSGRAPVRRRRAPCVTRQAAVLKYGCLETGSHTVMVSSFACRCWSLRVERRRGPRRRSGTARTPRPASPRRPGPRPRSRRAATRTRTTSPSVMPSAPRVGGGELDPRVGRGVVAATGSGRSWCGCGTGRRCARSCSSSGYSSLGSSCAGRVVAALEEGPPGRRHRPVLLPRSRRRRSAGRGRRSRTRRSRSGTRRRRRAGRCRRGACSLTGHGMPVGPRSLS